MERFSLIYAEIRQLFVCLLVILNWSLWWLSRGHPVSTWPTEQAMIIQKLGSNSLNWLRFLSFANNPCSGCRAVFNFTFFSKSTPLFPFHRHVSCSLCMWTVTCIHSDEPNVLITVSFLGFAVPTWSCFSQSEVSFKLSKFFSSCHIFWNFLENNSLVDYCLLQLGSNYRLPKSRFSLLATVANNGLSKWINGKESGC